MAKSKNRDEKLRSRKYRNVNGEEHASEVLKVNRNNSHTGLEKSRIRRPHKSSRSGFFRDIGSEFCKRILIGFLVFCCILAVFYLGVNYLQAVKRQQKVTKPINLPTMIGRNETAPDHSPELFWGTYRPNIFFGMSHRSPHSMLFGLAWVASDGKSVKLYHQCTSDGNIRSYNWIEHDGRNYGIQTIISGNHNITVTFVKRPDTPYGGDWTARISVSPFNKSRLVMPISVLFYAYLPDVSRGRIQSYADGSELKRLRGFTQELGAFQVNFHTMKDNRNQPTHLAGYCPREDEIASALMSGLALRKDHASVFFTGRQKDLFGVNVPMSDVPVNIWASEITLPGAGGSNITPDKVNLMEVEFVSQASTSSDAVSLTGKEFDATVAEHSKGFHQNFAKKFPHDPLEFNDEQIEMSKISLSNMLGGIGYFYGTSLITSPLLNSPGSNDSLIVDYFPAGLFTATPSRSQFPRGFLWDEGFHILLVGRWDVELALQSLGHWLDLLNAEGWIPREQILGWEARALVPKEFIVQSTSVANPPALIIAIEQLLDRRDTHMSVEEKAMFDHWMLLALPRLRAWFFWFSNTQIGLLPTSFRWRGRPLDKPSQLNPLTLASGLDDYPRSSHPTENERHLDLRCWMAAFARTISRIATHCENALRTNSPNDPSLKPLKALVVEFQGIVTELHDMKRLDELHWDESNGIYADYGLHTDKVALVQPLMDRAPAPGEPLPPKQRKVLEEPREQFVSSSIGYVTFFPLFLRILPPNSPRLPHLLRHLADSKLLWTPYGLRSLAPTSPFYNRKNSEHDPPYWRGAVWINMNYLAGEALEFYASHPDTPPEVANKARELQKRLSKAIVETVMSEMNRTGMTWERFDDRTGRGLSGHPFNGWTALVSLFMTN